GEPLADAEGPDSPGLLGRASRRRIDPSGSAGPESSAMIVDSHQHFWRLDRGDYNWLTPKLAPIHRDFGLADLGPILSHHNIDATVLVQAAATVAETDYILSLAAESAFVLGVVGWVDFESPDAPAEIERLACNPRLKGLRPMIQDLADPEWMLRPALQ